MNIRSCLLPVAVALAGPAGHVLGAIHGVPGDVTDLDGDGDTVEPLPLDLVGNPRIGDGDADGTPMIDMGAYEIVGRAPCPADLDGDGVVGITDLFEMFAHWGSDPGGPPDFDGDGNVGITDLFALFADWGLCP